MDSPIGQCIRKGLTSSGVERIIEGIAPLERLCVRQGWTTWKPGTSTSSQSDGA